MRGAAEPGDDEKVFMPSDQLRHRRAAIEHDAAVRLCREYLATGDEDERERLGARLNAYGGDIGPAER